MNTPLVLLHPLPNIWGVSEVELDKIRYGPNIQPYPMFEVLIMSHICENMAYPTDDIELMWKPSIRYKLIPYGRWYKIFENNIRLSNDIPILGTYSIKKITRPNLGNVFIIHSCRCHSKHGIRLDIGGPSNPMDPHQT